MSMDKTFDAAAAEPGIYAAWESAGAFAAGANARPGAETFSIVIPPPNVTGSLHIGHALNNTLQDILIRWKRMQGYDTLWQPGQDHAGIATQMVVERKLAAEQQPSRREMGREAFTAKVWEWKAESGSTILNQLRRLGASCDWSRMAFTMSGAPGAPEGEDGNFHDAVLKVFVGLHKAGLIYRDKRLVNWDPHFETAISDLEVEQVEEKGNLWRFRYKLADGETYDHPMVREEIDGEPTLRAWTPDDDDPQEWEERDYIVVATTRPETMLGDTGVAVAADDVRYAGLVGKSVILPLVGRRIPIVADQHADPTKGTGAVKITPAHDFNDFEVGKRAGLAAINVLGPSAQVDLFRNSDFWIGSAFATDGDQAEALYEAAWHVDPETNEIVRTQVESPELEALLEFDGLDRFEARSKLIEIAQSADWLDGIQTETHVVPHGDRSKVPIEPWLTYQWFVDAGKLAKDALAAAHDGRTNFHPANWVKTYDHWMENIEPWCISRQLWWGHQIPVWYGPEGRIYCEATEAAAIAAAEKDFGRSVVVKSQGDCVSEWLNQSEYGAEGSQNYIGKQVSIYRDEDVLDTWFSSGLWPMGTMGWPERTPELAKYYPTSVLITGFDIIFFWVARMMMMGLHFMKDEAGAPLQPFHDVYVHALVRDEKGKKMSKSLGNVIDPLELIDEFGADPVRFTLASMAAMGRDIKLAKSRVAGYRNFATKLWNAARFGEMNDCRPVPGFDPAAVSAPLNRWIVGETARLAGVVDAALAEYRFNDAANALYAHVWGVFCDWYVELSKPLLMGEDAGAKAETQATLAWALDQCLVMLHPFMPYVTEALWGQIAERPKMLIHADWPALSAETLADLAADRRVGRLIALIEAVRSVRAEMNVPPSARLPLLVLEADAELSALCAEEGALIARLARIEGIEAVDTAPKGAVTITLEGGAVALPLAGIVDGAAEKARLEKALTKVEKEAEGIARKLDNPGFLAKAPEEVVEENRERLDELRAEAVRLGLAAKRAAELV